jgi:hypothetical protein
MPRNLPFFRVLHEICIDVSGDCLEKKLNCLQWQKGRTRREYELSQGQGDEKFY